MKFRNKTVLITGAAGGIGTEMCKQFALAGAKIAALDRDDKVISFAEEMSQAGHTVAARRVDIGDAKQTSEAISSLREELGPIHILINNAGYSGASILEDTNDDIWVSDLNGNLNGAYFCTRNVINDMKMIDDAAIVNISSINGLAALGDPAYSAAKAGIISFTKSLALEYGRYGIRANVICPGTVRTPIWDHRIERNPEILEQLVKWYPLRRVADPIDIVRTAMFLASDDAAAITGAVLPVDCGLSAGNLVMTREITLADM
jgi:NAD(P)-dependent dehydrogenase (short-subunit alcohol dehydrogenase family)